MSGSTISFALLLHRSRSFSLQPLTTSLPPPAPVDRFSVPRSIAVPPPCTESAPSPSTPSIALASPRTYVFPTSPPGTNSFPTTAFFYKPRAPLVKAPLPRPSPQRYPRSHRSVAIHPRSVRSHIGPR